MSPPSHGRRLVLWRHGRTAWNLANRAQGHLDVPLDPVGVAQAGRAARRLATLQPAFLWSSDLRRARETAETLRRVTGLDVREDARLREYDVGLRGGLTWAEFGQRHPQEHARFVSDPHYRLPGAELSADVFARMAAVLHEAARAVPPGGVGVLVGHGAALASGVVGFFGAPVSQRNMFAVMDNCAWAVLHEHRARGWQLLDYNARTLPQSWTEQDPADAMPAGPPF